MLSSTTQHQLRKVYLYMGTSINCLRPLRDLKRADARRKPKAKAGCPWRGLPRSRCALQASPFGAYRRVQAPRYHF